MQAVTGSVPLNRPSALVVSLNFNPGHFSHLVANYRLLEEAGFTPYLYVDQAFNGMDVRSEFRKVNSPTGLSDLVPVRLAVFWFPSVKNIVEIVRLRLRWRSCIVYVLHEPFESFQRYRASGMGATRIWAINLVNVVVLLLSHAIILPSSSALRRYEEKYGWLRRRYSLVPLLFDDEAGPTATPIGKRYIAYIGTVAPDHAFDHFAEFAHRAMTDGWFPELTFAIATSSTIPAAQLALLQPHVDAGRLVVTSAHPLSTEEINNFYRDSLVVWNAYSRSMQSGVLPKAYMFGAAVISLSTNANEYVQDGVTGILIHDNKDVQAIRMAVHRILDRRDEFFSACRRAFLATFYYRNRLAIFDAIVNQVGSSTNTRND
jgi:glycosyltransferase involved in cell wall biosynthesis